MELSLKQQAQELIRKAKRIGIVLAQDTDLDAFASAHALGIALKALDKSSELLFSGAEPPEWKLLSFPLTVLPAAVPDTVIALNTEAAPVKEIRYEKKDKRIEIIVTPQGSVLIPDQIKIETGGYALDLLLALGVRSLESVGEIFEKNPHLFFNTALVNMDYSRSNENFGEVNILDHDASSIAEITFDLLRGLLPEISDENAATLFMTGLIYKTKNLQAAQPKTLLTASELKIKSKNYDKIAQALFKTKPLPLLKLWGRASVRSRLEENPALFWSFITAEDFEKTSTGPEEIKSVIEHFEENFSLPSLAIFLWQHPEEKIVRGAVRADAIASLEKIKPVLAGTASGLILNLEAQFPNFKEAEEKIRFLIGGQDFL